MDQAKSNTPMSCLFESAVLLLIHSGWKVHIDLKLKSEGGRRSEWNKELLADAKEVARSKGTLTDFEEVLGFGWAIKGHQALKQDLAIAWEKVTKTSITEYTKNLIMSMWKYCLKSVYGNWLILPQEIRTHSWILQGRTLRNQGSPMSQGPPCSKANSVVSGVHV